MIPQLKLTLAQLIALRVQHRHSPQDILRRLVIDGDTRVIPASKWVTGYCVCTCVTYIYLSLSLLPSPRSTGGSTLLPRWQECLSSLHLLSWLMLGAMCHNAIDTVALDMRVEGYTSGQCQLLGSLNTKMDTVTNGVAELTLGALHRNALSSEASRVR